MKKILVVEDEVAISMVLKAYLTKANYQVEQAFNGEEAVQKFTDFNPALVMLDIMLPGMDGWSILKYIRDRSSCPVIMLTALGQLKQKVEGLRQGADDYITKPFLAEEVVARVEAVLRRSVQILEDRETTHFGSLRIDFKAHTIYLHGLELPLIPRDLAVLLFLARHPNQTFTREQLIEQVWGIDYEGSDRAVDLSMKRIRKILQNWPLSEGELKTLRGLGYQFCVYEK
ncbi:response regulator transcription factor [Desulforamulus aeronauticus]|uniref:Stage 0 sporulation protein A homolog n=1 Tax=Desulforamulus aeronauticus DSM 10349 TaxID=1121421 RepID=A0A1M6TNM9_9FIRM|nr:response regulator transcription factor [Desulforamulus aeronauticus]SHK58557.1 DNA-binding response regulator, OmpR family, contains REC and winged-helix (wHTH) domain [Desulforamulus aeronauticus DSM 10349]